MPDLSDKHKFIKESILTIPNYPKQGILFRDITTLLQNPRAFKTTVELLIDRYKRKDINKVVGIEARGFIFAAPIALALSVPFVLVRKSNKLPRDVFKEKYQLEYGSSSLEVHTDAIDSNDNVLIVDDLLATGGTAVAAVKLIRKTNGIIKNAAFIINLSGLGGKEELFDMGVDCFSVISFEHK